VGQTTAAGQTTTDAQTTTAAQTTTVAQTTPLQTTTANSVRRKRENNEETPEELALRSYGAILT
jgi:hypothetical protein